MEYPPGAKKSLALASPPEMWDPNRGPEAPTYDAGSQKRATRHRRRFFTRISCAGLTPRRSPNTFQRPLPACPAGEAVRRLIPRPKRFPRPLPARPAGEAVRRLIGAPLADELLHLPGKPA